MFTEQLMYDGDDEMDYRYRGRRRIRKKIVLGGQFERRKVPLSIATLEDNDSGRNTAVINDILKIVVLGGATAADKQGFTRRLIGNHQPKRKRTTSTGTRAAIHTTKEVDAHTWTPTNDQNTKFRIWTVHENGGMPDPTCNTSFATHPAATQSKVFSDRSLYLLVWDLAANNKGTYRLVGMVSSSSDSDSSHDSEDHEDDYLKEVTNFQADRSLQMDVLERVVLPYVDGIAQRTAHSAILPVAFVPTHMASQEIERRCHILIGMLLDHCRKLKRRGYMVPKVLSGARTVYGVSLERDMGFHLLEETILEIANDAHRPIFDHVGAPVPKGVVAVWNTCQQLKESNHQLVSLDLLLSALPPTSKENLSVHQVMVALEFLSCIGELFYFGNTSDENVDTSNILTQFVHLP